MAIDPRRLLVLHAVARTGSARAAAERLHLTPSAVSQHLARLEAEAGVGLLDRTRLGGGRAIGLTAAGRALAEHAEAVATALASAEEALAHLRGGPVGDVVIGAFPTATRHVVAPAVAALAREHPALRPRVVEASEPAALVDLAAGRLDVAVLEHDGDAPPRSTTGIVERPLLRDEYRVVVPAAWPALTDDEVLAGPWVAGPAGSAARAALERLASGAVRAGGGGGGGGAAGARSGRALHVAHECLEFPAVLALVGAGLGAALVPRLATAHGEHPGVVPHGGALEAGARVLVLAHRTSRHEPTAAVEVVLAALRREAGRTPSG